ncbi:unnamed protein product [Anisakis simplex]|uniref:Transmembrane protein 237 homolog (inferred by orthology to a C. elegans protein) n=1 Tax=Anisakis simplex TaxID=6269 RepID=A0A0M3JV68_ANISI|nr:unnamed protein product [Anisakis simplex]
MIFFSNTFTESKALQQQQQQQQQQQTAENAKKTNANILSQPSHDVFVQYNQSFRRTDRKRYEEMQQRSNGTDHQTRTYECIDAALTVQTFFHNLSLISQGFLSGLAVAHAVFAFVLARKDMLEEGYNWIAMPVHATFYIGFVISAVSALDRFEFTNGFMETLKSLLNHQCAVLGILFWTTGLCATVTSTPYDECLAVSTNLKSCQIELGVSPHLIWRWLSAVRAIAALSGWFLLALSPDTNSLRERIRQEQQ